MMYVGSKNTWGTNMWMDSQGWGEVHGLLMSVGHFPETSQGLDIG